MNPPRTCGLDRQWLHIYLNGDLTSAEERVLEVHLQRCADCQQELAWLRCTEFVLAAATPVPAPSADFTARLLARAAAEGMRMEPAASRSRLAGIRRVARRATTGFRYAGRGMPDVSVPKSWRERASDVLGRGVAATGRGLWQTSRWLLRRQRRPQTQPKPSRSRFSLPRARLPGLGLLRLVRQPSR